jgi:hypothetical protein
MIWGKIKKLANEALWQDPNYSEEPLLKNPIIFNNVDQDLYDKIVAQGHANDLEFNGNEVKAHGCTLDWVYDKESLTLTVTPIKLPIYISHDEVVKSLTDLLKKARNSI